MEFALGTVLPVITLGALGAVLPVLLARVFSDTLAGLTCALAVSAVLLLLIGAGLFLLMYRDAGADLSALVTRPVAAARHFLSLGLKAALVWGPVLALTGFALAHGVEARRGRRMAARRDPD